MPGNCRLAPAYDFCFSHNPAAGKWTCEQEMRVNGKTWNIEEEGLLALAKTFGVSRATQFPDGLPQGVCHIAQLDQVLSRIGREMSDDRALAEAWAAVTRSVQRDPGSRREHRRMLRERHDASPRHIFMGTLALLAAAVLALWQLA